MKSVARSAAIIIADNDIRVHNRETKETRENLNSATVMSGIIDFD